MNMHHHDALLPWRGRRHLVIGFTALIILVGGLGAWTVYAPLAGAVIASGRIVVEANRQVVQHPDGGVVSEILTRDGKHVHAGDVLIRFDDTFQRAELALVEHKIDALEVNIARLKAERDGTGIIQFPAHLFNRDKETTTLIKDQRGLFAARRHTQVYEVAQLRERQSRIREEITGYKAQRKAAEAQLGLIEDQLDAQRTLLEKGLARLSSVLGLERQLADLKGQVGALISRIGEARGRIVEINVEITRLKAERSSDASEAVQKVIAELNQMRERQQALQERLARLELRAPRDGIVIEMAVHALRSVVRGAEPILYIVPVQDELLIDTQIRPQDVDRIYLGQQANIRFSAFNARTTPEVEGNVVAISADTIKESRNFDDGYYHVKVALKEDALQALSDYTLIPGMPAEVFLRTETRTPISYLLKPFTDYLERAMRER